jgi:predicted esterase
VGVLTVRDVKMSILSLSILLAFCAFVRQIDAASLLGHEIVPGHTADIQFPVDEYFQNYAAEGGNPKPATGRMVFTAPKNFDPSRAWPILIVTSTTDANRTSPMDSKWYEIPATREGWIVLATDATIRAKQDSTNWRLGLTAAALEDIHREWPQSKNWPIAFGGFSGGAKRSCFRAAMLAKTGTLRICGLYLTGINDDQLTPAYEEFQPPPDFLNTPIWITCGTYDQIAPLAKVEAVQTSMRHTGFKQIPLGIFPGRHEIAPAEVQRALRWFREVGRF